MRAVLRMLAVVLSCAIASACASEALLAPLNWGESPSVVTQTDLPYGADERQQLDVYRPAGASNAPVIVFWYGGSWRRGAKEYYGFVGTALARQGFVAVLPDYRLAPKHPFPDFVLDAAAAVRWARDHAAELGGDPDRLYLSGHSAGGHTAMMLALDDRYLREVGMQPHDVAGVISLAGPTGLENLRGRSLAGVFPLEIPDARFSPIALALQTAAAAPPFLLMTGLDDDVIYASSIERLAHAIRAGGGRVVVEMYPDTGHIGLVLDFSGLFDSSSGVATRIAQFAGLGNSAYRPVAMDPAIASPAPNEIALTPIDRASDQPQ
jgi:acetyl esterase/lipase